MNDIVALVSSWKEIGTTYIVEPFRHFGVRDAVDILLLCALLYGVYLFIRERRAAKLVLGLIPVGIVYLVCDWLDLRAMNRLFDILIPIGILLLAVIFQPELRDALEKLGSFPKGCLFGRSREKAEMAVVIDEVISAACEIAQSEKDGALIVIERDTRLGEYVRSGTRLDAAVSASLLRNIFVDRTPLHDGAVIIRDGRIAASCCMLPLSVVERSGERTIGMRHRSAIGITEVSDCVAVVVSEERHTISITNSGVIRPNYNSCMEDLKDPVKSGEIREHLRRDLTALLLGRVDKSHVGTDGKHTRSGNHHR